MKVQYSPILCEIQKVQRSYTTHLVYLRIEDDSIKYLGDTGILFILDLNRGFLPEEVVAGKTVIEPNNKFLNLYACVWDFKMGEIYFHLQ